jgi:hypothetical protein
VTPKRWEIVGGSAFGLICIIAFDSLQSDPWSWPKIALAIGIGALGNGVGRWLVREWQQAGHQ